jgi:hypothetical protein
MDNNFVDLLARIHILCEVSRKTTVRILLTLSHISDALNVSNTYHPYNILKGMLTFEKHVHFLLSLFISILKATETHLRSAVKNISLLVKFII